MCGFRWAGCSQRNVQQYRRTAYSSTTACKSNRALAGVLYPCTHAAQQIGPFASVRQEITPCLVWSFPLKLGLRRRRRRGGGRLGVQAAIDPVQLLATAMESGPHVGSKVKSPFPSGTSACSGFNQNGLVSELGSATMVAS